MTLFITNSSYCQSFVISPNTSCDLDTAIYNVIHKGDTYSHFCLKKALEGYHPQYNFNKEVYFFFASELAFKGNKLAYYNMYKGILDFYKRYNIELNKEVIDFANIFYEKSKNMEDSTTYLNDTITDRLLVKKISFCDLYNHINSMSCVKDCSNEAYFFFSMVMAFKYNYADAFYDLYLSFIEFYNKHHITINDDLRMFLKYILKTGEKKGCDSCRLALREQQ